MHLEQLPSGSWRVTVQHAGHKRRDTRPTKTEARLHGAQLLLEMGGKPSLDPTIQEIVDAYLLEARHAETTREQIDRALSYIPATFMARRAAEVTPIVAAGLWREMEKIQTNRGPLSLHTIKRAQDLLSMAWQLAQKYDWATPAYNPFTVAASDDPDDPDEVNPPTTEQVRTLIGAARDIHGNPRPLALWIRLASVTGMRRGELCGLRWGDLRLDRCELIVRHAATNRKGGGTGRSKGKTGRKGHRVIELDPQTVARLQAHQRHPGCPYVFTHDRVGPWRPDYVTLEFRRLCDRLSYTDIHPHSLRHYAATQWLARGYSIADVSYLLGNTPATVVKVYIHHIPANAREAVSELALALDE